MSELKNLKLDYLNDKEIIEFYELFFGNILIKKPGFSYYSNLSKCLNKENVVQGILDKLNINELNILEIISRNIYIPYDFLIEKIHIITNIPAPIIKKSISTLIEKKYIFTRDDKKIVVPNVFFTNNQEKTDYTCENNPNTDYFSKTFTDICNILNYFISKEIKHSNSYSLYKKDYIELENIFTNYSAIKNDEYSLITYFYAVYFLNEEGLMVLDRVKKFYKSTTLEKINIFIRIIFPWFNTIINTFNKLNITPRFSFKAFENLWINSFLLSEYKQPPIDFDFKATIKFLEKINAIYIDHKEIIIPLYIEQPEKQNNEMRLSSSFSFFINADNINEDFFLPAFFADFIKYNKVIEYEITENSIKRAIINGYNLEDIINYFEKYEIKIPKNVETTITQWFDQHASFFYSNGIHFFCQTKEKGKLINSLIAKGLIKAYQLKTNEVFLIPEEEKENFFNFIEKSGIYYYNRKPMKTAIEVNEKILNINQLLNRADQV